MGTGWRRAFCTTIPRDSETATVSKKQQTASPCPSPSPRSCSKLGFFSNPSTPRLQSQPVSSSSSSLRCRTATLEAASVNEESPRLHCKTSTPKATKTHKSSLGGSNPSSPTRSPLKLSLFKNSFKFRSSCGICSNSVKTGQGTAIYTAECSHAFHFPCIASHVSKHGRLVCPVCNTGWKDVPLLATHHNLDQNDAASQDNVNVKIKVEEKKFIESSPMVAPSDSRSYDDDEPLLSPTGAAAAAAGRFNPIPEADENVEEEENDVEEFQGFFVHPNPSSSFKSDQVQIQFNGRDSRTVQLRLLPESAVISVGKNYETCAVALRVKAPPPAVKNNNSASHQAPIDLVTVLDVTGSMAGAKLQMLKRAMRLVISSLGSADRLSILAFSASSKRLLPLRRMTAQGQRVARRIIDRLVCGQGTSTSGGEALRMATKVLEDRREKNPVASIVLLSDGQDERVQINSSNQSQRSSHASSTRFAHIEIPVRSSGFGYGPEPAEDAFTKCVGGLLSVVVQDLRIQLSFASGSEPAEISAVYSCNGRPTVLSAGSVRLGDLYAEEERDLLVELRFPTSAVGSQSQAQAHHVMSVKCRYKDPATQAVVYGADHQLLVPCPNAARSSSAPKIERLRSLFISTRAIAESRRIIEQNDFTSAHHLLASARALLIHSSSESSEEHVRRLEIELAELHWKRQQQQRKTMMMMQRRRGSAKEAMVMTDENGEPLTPMSAWRAAEKLAKVAMMKKKSLNRVSDLHGFENARF